MQLPFLKPRPESPPPTSIHPEPTSLPPNPFLAIHHHFTSLLSHLPNPNPNPLSTISALADHAKQAFHAAASRLAPPPPTTPIQPLARLSPALPAPRIDLAMSPEAIEERLAGVPVYALSNSDEEFVLVSGKHTGRSLGLFCFKEEDAQALLDQMMSMDPSMRNGSKVVALSLNKLWFEMPGWGRDWPDAKLQNCKAQAQLVHGSCTKDQSRAWKFIKLNFCTILKKVFQLKVDGVAFRFIPDLCQVANAIKSRSLVLRSQNKRYHPVFFRKEDLEDSLLRASRQQRTLNPMLRQGDIQVGVLEEIIDAMKGNSQKWDDVVFIPPGLDVPTGVAVEGHIATA